MRLFKNFFALLLTGVMTVNVGCGMHNETSRKIIRKERDEVEADVEAYLEEKYGKAFVVAVTDNPNHIYSSYAASAYAADDESKEMFSATITYADEENYSVTDDYFMYTISDDLELWFTELADPYIDCEFKAFFYPFSDLPSDYDDCKTAEDFLARSPTGTYYGLIFHLFLPHTEYDSPIDEICASIMQEMLNQKIRGQIQVYVYEDETVYNQINTKKDARYFWTHSYQCRYCTGTIKIDFSTVFRDVHETYAFN